MIRVDDVAVSLGDVRVLDGVSVDVDPGEFVGLVGPNGAGKTTLLRTVTGALGPDAGAAFVDGDDVADLSSRATSRRVAAVPQDTSVRFAFDVEDVVAMGRTPHRSRFGSDPDAADHVDRALRRTETTDLRNRRVDTLSGGERQRVFVARALAQDAPALVLDEPTASLDVNHAAETLSLVRELADEGRAVLAAIHDLEAAARYCDRLVLLHDGAVVADGAPASVLTSDALGTAFDVRAAVTENPVSGSPTVTALPATRHGDRRVHVLGSGATAARVVAACWAAGHDVTLGPVPRGTAAVGVAESVDAPAVTVEPFAPIGTAARDGARECVDDAAVTVLADVDVDPAAAVLDLGERADRRVVVEDRSLATRNGAGDDGRRRYERLRDRADEATRDDVAAVVERVADRALASGE